METRGLAAEIAYGALILGTFLELFFRFLGDLMDSFELNKIAGAVLFTLLVYLGVQNFGAIMFDPAPASPEAYVVEGVEEEGSVAVAAVAEEVVVIDPKAVWRNQCAGLRFGFGRGVCQGCCEYPLGGVDAG